MQSNSLLLIGFLILIFIVSGTPFVSGSGAGVNLTCPPVFINSAEILNDSDNLTAGSQIIPPVPDNCVGVLRCSSRYIDTCNLAGGIAYCGFNASGANVGLEKGGYCMAPGGVPLLCNNSPVSGCIGECDFHENGEWAGFMKGEYCYDANDGYKGIDGKGIKKVAVKVNMSSPAGIKMMCSNRPEGNNLKMTIDNYESRDTYQINFQNPPECYNDSIVSDLTSAVWVGEFNMHYWEKPGIYGVKLSIISECQKTSEKTEFFEYLSSAQLCLSPKNVNMDYGSGDCPRNNATYYGDVNMGDCNQSDIGSPKATIRNIGNTMVNAIVQSTDMKCISPGCGDVIPASNLYIDFGNGWNNLQKDPESIHLASHCNCLNYYGLPPGPHATNVLNLMISPLNCVEEGFYWHDLTITAEATEGDCQDNREIRYPAENMCIEPPQCYEANRCIIDQGINKTQFESICAP